MFEYVIENEDEKNNSGMHMKMQCLMHDNRQNWNMYKKNVRHKSSRPVNLGRV